MGSATAPLVLTPDPVAGLYRTAAPFSYDVGFKGSALTIVVPAGFATDLASVPRWLWWLFPRDDPQYAAAAVLHDYLYRWGIGAERFDRGTADAIFLEFMLILGVPTWKAWAMYAAVRLFGQAPYDRRGER